VKEATSQKILKSVPESYNLIANEFSDTRHYAWEEFKFFKPYLFENAEIVDLGCGNGRLNLFLDQYYLGQKYRYIGIDNSENLLKAAQKKFPRKIFLPGDQIDIPLSENQADIVFNIAAFHHIPSPKLRLQALADIKRILKPNGLLIMTVWNLWQKKYFWHNLRAWLKSIITFGDYAPNDLFIPWRNDHGKKISERYYHNFLPVELNNLLKKSGFTTLENFTVRNGKKTAFFKGYNYIIIARSNEQ